MLKATLHLCYLLLVSPVLFAAGDNEVVRRALEYVAAWSNSREEPAWLTAYVPEFVHPEANDSGLPGRRPDFVPAPDSPQGLFLYQGLTAGRVFSGTSPWVLDGREKICAVEVLFQVVAEVDDRVRIYRTPVQRTEMILLAVDAADGKWKVVDHFPYKAYFYEIPYFLKAWEKIKGRNSVKNIPEVRDKLLALVQEPRK